MQVRCGDRARVLANPFACKAPCGGLLPGCEHPCGATCGTCCANGVAQGDGRRAQQGVAGHGDPNEDVIGRWAIICVYPPTTVVMIAGAVGRCRM